MRYVMEWMCPRLPDGFCTAPSQIAPVLRAADVKQRTAELFRLPLTQADIAERRLEHCVNKCPAHTRRGFCLDCTGLLDWLYRGFGGARGRLPADRATGVCVIDKVMVAASAAVTGYPPAEGAEYPEGCWRKVGAVCP
jgi:hypothetical protein